MIEINIPEDAVLRVLKAPGAPSDNYFHIVASFVEDGKRVNVSLGIPDNWEVGKARAKELARVLAAWRVHGDQNTLQRDLQDIVNRQDTYWFDDAKSIINGWPVYNTDLIDPTTWGTVA